MDGPCVLPWLPATHAVATAESDLAAHAVLASAPQRCSRTCFPLGRDGARLRTQHCDNWRAVQYAATVLVCACEGGSLPSARVALDALHAAGTWTQAPMRGDGPIWMWLMRALTRALRGCLLRDDEVMAAVVAAPVHLLAQQTAYPRMAFWRDGGGRAAAEILWQRASPRCARVLGQSVDSTSLVALYALDAEASANDLRVCPLSFAAFWAPVLEFLHESANNDPTGAAASRGYALVFPQLSRALARGEWRASSAWLAAWDAAPLAEALGLAPDALWPLCVAALTGSALGAECRLLRRLVRSSAVRVFESSDVLGARASVLWDSAVAARHLGGQATTTDLAPWMRLCAELHPGVTTGWSERRVRGALCARGERK